METMLKTQGDSPMEGRGHVFDNSTPSRGDGSHKTFIRGDKVSAGWVNPSDFEKQSVKP